MWISDDELAALAGDQESSVRRATDQEITRLAERRRGLPFDVTPVEGASLRDLDVARFRSEYLPRAVAPEELARNAHGDEARLLGARMVVGSDLTPTVSGVLLLTDDPTTWLPGAWIDFIRVRGDHLRHDAVVDHARLVGSLFDLPGRLEDKLRSHLRVAVKTSSGREEHVPEYPLAALQELVRNAICHRSYEYSNTPIRVRWFDDRVEIESPGGLFGLVTPESFWQGATDYRNPSLAKVLNHLGLVNQWGMGLHVVQTELEGAGLPPAELRANERVIVIVRQAET